MQQRPLSLAVAGLLILAPALSPAEDLDGRVTRLENMLDSQRASDLTLQVQTMEREMQRLRGLVEQQQFELDRLRRQGGQAAPAGGARPGSPAGQAPGGEPETAAAAGTGSPVARGEASAAPKGAEPARPGEASPPATSATPAGQPPGGSRAGVESAPPPLTAVASPSGTAPPPPPAGESAQTSAAEAPEQLATEQSAAAAPPGRGEQEAYIKAVEPLKQRRFEEAAVTLSDFIARYPNSASADKAHFWLAETHYVNRNVTAALKEFQTVLKDYPKSSKVPGALLKIGYIQDDAKDPRAARATLQELIRRFPQSGEARLAQSRLDQMTQEGR